MFEDFESAYIEGGGESIGGINLSHSFVFGERSRIWIEGLDESNITPHSGSRCLGLEVESGSTTRNEFNLRDTLADIGHEQHVKVWVYFPANWHMSQGDPGDWYEIANPYMHTDGAPYSAAMIYQPNPAETEWNIALALRDKYGDYSITDVLYDFPLKRGEWFPLEWEMVHDSNGRVKLWFDSSLVGEQFVDNISLSEADMMVSVGKVYYNPVEPETHHLWVDDVLIESLNGGNGGNGGNGDPTLTQSDSSGNYIFSDLEPGIYEITCEKADFTTQIETVEVLSGQDTYVSFRQLPNIQENGRIIGSVTKTNGTAISLADIAVVKKS